MANVGASKGGQFRHGPELILRWSRGIGSVTPWRDYRAAGHAASIRVVLVDAAGNPLIRLRKAMADSALTLSPPEADKPLPGGEGSRGDAARGGQASVGTSRGAGPRRLGRWRGQETTPQQGLG